MIWLKQSTASQEIPLGRFVDITDGNTPETGLSPANTDIKLWKTGATTLADKNSGGATHIATGIYYCTLDATDTDTLGPLEIHCHIAATALPVVQRCLVLPANVYDSLVLGTDVIDTNVTQISGDSTAADNLELQYDTTGLTGDTFPATQASVGAIATTSGGVLNFEAESDNTGGAIKSVTFVGVQTSGTYASTEANDGTYHQIDDTGNAIDIVYQFDVGGGRTASEVVFIGYLSSNNDSINVQAYDYIGADWETRAVIAGQVGSADISETISLLSKHTGTGSDLGKVLIRFVCTGQTNPTLYVDELIVGAISVSQTVGYALGAIWVNDSLSNTTTESFVDGVADNPVSTWAAALTIAGNTNLQRFQMAGGTTITLSGNSDNYELLGENWTLALGGQSTANMHVTEATVSGTATGSGSDYHECTIGTCTMAPTTFYSCQFTDTLTMGSAGAFRFNRCESGIAGASAPVIDFGALGASTLELRDWRGGVTLNNLASGDVVTLDGIFGTITLNGADATVEIRGIYKAVTNNLTGSPSVTMIGVKGTDVADILVDTGTTIPALVGTPAADLSADIAAVKAETALIVADTNELQTDWADGGRLDLIIDAVATPAQVNTQMLDVLNTDTFAELGAVPAATSTLADKITFIFMMARNKTTQTATTKILLDDAGTGTVATSTVSDDATTFTKGEFV